MLRIPIKVGQIWESKSDKRQFLITGYKADKFLCKVLTEKPNSFNGSHRMSRHTLWARFALLK